MKIPAYYAANVERLACFASVMIEKEREAIDRNKAAGRDYCVKFYRAKLQAWRDVLGNPAAFVTQ